MNLLSYILFELLMRFYIHLLEQFLDSFLVVALISELQDFLDICSDKKLEFRVGKQ